MRVPAQGHITYANDEWLRIVGVPALGPECDRWLDAVDAADLEAVKADWATALKSADFNFSREFRFRRPESTAVVWINGRSLAETELSTTMTLAMSADAEAAVERAPQVRAIVGAFTDVTHWRQLEQQQMVALAETADVQLRRAEDAEKSRREQERFVDIICHEIRNPLSGIVNNVDQLREGRKRTRAMLCSLLLSEGSNAALESVLKQLDEEEGMLQAIDLCAAQQVHRSAGQ